MPWTYVPPDEWNAGWWYNTDNGERSRTDPNLVPSAENLWGWDPNMPVPEGGFTVGQLLAPNYLSQGTTLDDPAALAAAVSDVAPRYTGPLDMNARVPNNQVRAPAKDNGFENLLGAGAMAGLGFLSGGFGIPELWGNLFGSPTTITSASGANPTLVGGSFENGMDWLNTDWGTEGLVDLGSSGYNAVAANDPIGALIQNLESGMTPSQAVSAVETALPGTTRSALEQFLYETTLNSGNGLSRLFGNSLGGQATSGLGSLFGGSNSGGLFSGLFGSGIGGMIDKGIASAPVLAAINYARNQDPFDTSRLTSLYDQYDPSKLAYEYDLNTGRGRDQLTSSLQNRGVMGSSFGNMDITNFNTTRELGRQSLINQGIGQRGQIASNILDAEVKGRQLKNQLYGSSLLALGNVFGGRSSPTINFGGF